MTKSLSVLFALGAMAAASALHAAPNLVPNGSFEGGNTDFTSSYGYTPGSNTAEGQYTVRSNPFPWNGAFISMADHTSGAGNMYVGNGSPVDGAVVWQSSVVAVSASTDYFFEAWVTNVCCTSAYNGPNSASVLEFSINGLTVGTKSTSLNQAGTWEGLSTTWNSGSASTAVLQLINRNTAVGGNDFAIDDISLSTESTVSPVPEPTTLMLLVSGLMVVGLATRRQKPTR